MSVQPGDTYKRYAANGVATVYAIPFLLLDAADLQITLNGTPVTTGFTLVGVGSPVSSCTFSVAPAGDLLFQQVVPFQRLTDYQNNGDFLAITVNRDFDRLWLAVKQLNRDSGRALTVSLLEPEGIPPLPVKAVRALKVLAFDANGNPIPSNLTLAQLEQQPALALEAATQAQASAVAAGDSKDAAAQSQVAAAASEALAQKWAENPEDTPVLPGQFSAHHWANKAAATILTAQKQIQDVTASVAANALTLGWVKSPISFRSTTLTSGLVNTRNPASNLSLVIPSGATLGTLSATAAKVVLLAIDSAGTVELAVTNIAGGINLDETELISTTAIGAGSTSASAIYSAVARTNVPFRVVGVYDSLQPVAGTWTVTPKAQGQGGQNIVGGSRLSVSSERVASGVSMDFTNIPSWAKKITLCLSGIRTNGGSPYLIQIGSASFDVTGYQGATSRFTSAATFSQGYTSGFALQKAGAAEVYGGSVTLMNVSGNTWVANGAVGGSAASATLTTAGNKSLSGVLDRVRITTVNGTDAFDAGTISVFFEG